MITIFNIALTIGVYNLSRVISKRFSSPITTPVFLSTVLVITILLLLNITYTDYKPALQIMTLLLGRYCSFSCAII
ncbi:LrgB family protein [Neobacillus sp. PS3-34]|uniref:LrgB family protein n=1 Tax=Neobacillus sp. PS3-34 TaxID=3070678 RepID=UPI0027DEB69F|nr:LrgB family protein [Neobacillus sp. PS3-34]WML47937.1 LrgB family protein [Neobacillus sp. PS3-34]